MKRIDLMAMTCRWRAALRIGLCRERNPLEIDKRDVIMVYLKICKKESCILYKDQVYGDKLWPIISQRSKLQNEHLTWFLEFVITARYCRRRVGRTKMSSISHQKHLYLRRLTMLHTSMRI